MDYNMDPADMIKRREEKPLETRIVRTVAPIGSPNVLLNIES